MMQDNLSTNLFASENAKIKGYLLMHHLGRILPMAKKYTRQQQLDNLKLMSANDIMRSFKIAYNNYETDNEQSVWEYDAVEQEMLRRMAY